MMERTPSPIETALLEALVTRDVHAADETAPRNIAAIYEPEFRLIWTDPQRAIHFVRPPPRRDLGALTTLCARAVTTPRIALVECEDYPDPRCPGCLVEHLRAEDARLSPRGGLRNCVLAVGLGAALCAGLLSATYYLFGAGGELVATGDALSKM